MGLGFAFGCFIVSILLLVFRLWQRLSIKDVEGDLFKKWDFLVAAAGLLSGTVGTLFGFVGNAPEIGVWIVGLGAILALAAFVIATLASVAHIFGKKPAWPQSNLPSKGLPSGTELAQRVYNILIAVFFAFGLIFLFTSVIFWSNMG